MIRHCMNWLFSTLALGEIENTHFAVKRIKECIWYVFCAHAQLSYEAHTRKNRGRTKPINISFGVCSTVSKYGEKLICRARGFQPSFCYLYNMWKIYSRLFDLVLLHKQIYSFFLFLYMQVLWFCPRISKEPCYLTDHIEWIEE